MDFIKWYKHIIESSEEEPPAKVWQEIENELDVDAVWVDIEKNLSGGVRKRMMVMMTAAATVLLIISVGTLLFLNLRDQDFVRGPLYTERFPVSPELLKREPAIQTSLSTALDFPVIREIHPMTEEKDPQPAVHPGPALEDLQSMPYLEYKPVVKERDLPVPDLLFPLTGEEKVSKQTIFSSSGYYAGLSGHLANTWLVNNKTMQGLRPDEFTTSLPSFGYSTGLVAGITTGKRFGIEAEVHLISFKKQNYNEYLHGKYISNSMQFNYFSLSLSGKWYFTDSEKPGRHSALLGTYTGILRNAIQNINGESISLSNDFNSGDFGIIAGYEYHHPVGNSLSIGTGFQARVGLNNIFAGNDLIPDYLNSTRNASLNLKLSVRYNLK